MNSSRRGLKSQDILILLKLLAIRLSRPKTRNKPHKFVDQVRAFQASKGLGVIPKQADIALALGISQAEVTHALSRLRQSGFLSQTNEFRPLAISEFLLHGLKYVFPAISNGGMGRGIPSGLEGAEELKKRLSVSKHEPPIVWAHPEGKAKGILIEPLYPSAPIAAQKDEKLYELLSLVDSIRYDGAGTREKKFALEILEKKISSALQHLNYKPIKEPHNA